MCKIIIGTSGYSYKDWIGPVYPAGTESKDFLSFYAAEFNLVELNFSYYAMPKANILNNMIKRTPDTFLFNIKAHKTLTHTITGNSQNEAEEFKKSIIPLMDASRLGTILFQFPYSFHYNIESRKHLDLICRLFTEYPIAIEFRNIEWQKESVYAGLTERNVTIVNIDEPDLPKLPKAEDAVTSETGYIRFHGRNKDNWWKGDNTSRYDYLYSKDELSDWIDKIKNIIKKVKMLLVVFNNHYKGKAVQNARDIKKLIKDKLDIIAE